MRTLPLALALPLLLVPSIALPCSAPLCWEERLFPLRPFPANLPMIFWSPSWSGSETATVADADVYLESPAGDRISVTLAEYPNYWPFTYEVHPSVQLTPNVEYTLRTPDGCEPYDPLRTIKPVATATVPSTLGTASVTHAGRELIDVRGNGGTCTDKLDASFAMISVELTAEAQPWAGALLYTTKVDGEIWYKTDSLHSHYEPGSSWIGRGRDKIYASCQNNVVDGLSEGVHEVVFEATVPGANILLSTPPIMVTLSCAASPPPPDAGVGDDAEVLADASVPSGSDASVSSGTDAGAGLQESEDEPSSCAGVRGGASLANIALLFGVLWVISRRRKS